MRPFTPLLRLCLLLVVAAPCAAAAAGEPPAIPRSAAPVPTLERKVLDHSLRGDLLGVLSLTEESEGRPLLYRGLSLEELGSFRLAQDSYSRLLLALPVQDAAWEQALERSLAISRTDLSLPLPTLSPGAIQRSDAGTSLALGCRLLRQGDLAGGLSFLKGIRPAEPGQMALATAVTAQAEFAAGHAGSALARLNGFRVTENSPRSDLVKLLRGYHNLEAKDLERARETFVDVPPESPYAPEAIFGLAWVLIQSGNLAGAVVRLEELLRTHPDAAISREAVLDLALAYRNLSLYDQASSLLSREMRRLTENRQWLEALREKDFAPGREMGTLLEDALEDRGNPTDAWNRTPSFARAFLLAAAADPEVAGVSALLRGTILLRQAVLDLKMRYADAAGRTTADRRYLADLGEILLKESETLSSFSTRLMTIHHDYLLALQREPLQRLASPELLVLLNRTAQAKERLRFLTSAEERARGFSSVIRDLTTAEITAVEQKHLKKLREEAYASLLGSRDAIDDLQERLLALEGRIWLAAKLGTLRLEDDLLSRIAAASDAHVDAARETGRARALLRQMDEALASTQAEVGAAEIDLGLAFPERLDHLRDRLLISRARRFLALARQKEQDLRDAEARVLYVAADVEIARMEERLRSMRGETK